MISTKRSQYILFMGIDCANPKGGIAQVLYTYKKYIFETFRFIPTTNTHNVLRRQITGITAGFKLLYHLLCHNVKVVHLHGGSGKSFYRKSLYINLCKLFRVKIIYHIHGGNFKNFTQEHPTTVDTLLKKCDTIVALNERWATYFRAQGCGNVTAILNPIEPPVFLPVEKDSERLHLVFLGTITSRKGIYDLLQALNDNRDTLADKIVLHIGGIGESKQLLQTIKNLHLEDMVLYHGFVAGEEKIKLFNTGDIFVLPSYIEGLPISILEAMSYRMPIIASNVGGIPDVVTDGENGYLITPGDTKKLGESIISLINSPELYASMSRKSEESAIAYYPAQIEKSLDKLYDKYL